MPESLSSFFSTIPVSHALFEAPKEIDLNINWQATSGNALQEMIMKYNKDSLRIAEMLSSKELMSKAAPMVFTVNDFLAANGFGDVQLEDNGKGLYAASIIKLLGQFMAEGTRNYHLEKINKTAFRMSKEEAKVVHFDYKGQTVVEIPTKSNFSLLVTAPTGVDGFTMIDDWYKIISTMKYKRGNGVILPMADIKNTKIDVDAMKGMTDEKRSWFIVQALMAANFALTPSSVKFEAAFAYGAKRAMMQGHEPEDGDYVADHALYFALARRGELMPLAAGLVDVSDLSKTELG